MPISALTLVHNSCEHVAASCGGLEPGERSANFGLIQVEVWEADVRDLISAYSRVLPTKAINAEILRHKLPADAIESTMSRATGVLKPRRKHANAWMTAKPTWSQR